jgi:cold shock CspA family protein
MSKLIKYIIENNMQDEKFTGEVVWYDERKGHGIISVSVCAEGHEVFIDSSVLQGDFVPSRGDYLEFNFNTDIKHVACAKNVTLI